MRFAALFAAGFAVLAASPTLADDLPRFTMDARPDLDWVTVPVVRPTARNMPVALDVIPNGKPKENGVFGAAWVHVCDNDLHNGPLNCAMVSAGDKAVRFGSSNFQGEPPRPIEFVVGNKIVGTITTKQTINVGEFNSAAVLKRLDALAEQNRRQAEEIRRLKDRVADLETTARRTNR